MIKINYNYYNKNDLKEYANQPVFDEKKGMYITRKKHLKKNISRDMNSLSLALLFFILVQFTVVLLYNFMQYALYNNGMYFNIDSVTFSYAISAATTAIGLLLPYLIYLKVTNQYVFELIKFEKNNLNSVYFVLAGLGLGFASNIPVNLISLLLEDSESLNFEVVDTYLPSNALGYIIMFFAVAVMPAFVEEFVLRGVFLGKIRKYGDAFAIIVSSLIFAVLHQNIPTIMVTFVSGCIMGWIYVKTNSLWPSIIVHLLNNTFSVVLVIISEIYGESDLGILITSLMFYVPIILAFISLYKLKNKIYLLDFENKFNYVGGFSKFSSAIINPCTILLIFYCITYAMSVLFGW